MALPGTVSAPSNPFVISATPIEDPLAMILRETSVLEEQFIVFTVKEDAGGGMPPGGPRSAESGGDDGGGTPAEEFDFTPKSVTVEIDMAHGLTVEYDGETTFRGKYANSLFGNASIEYLDTNYLRYYVSSWEQVPFDNPDFFSIVKFQDTATRQVTAVFKVTAVIEMDAAGEIEEIVLTETFTQTVTNDWTSGRDALVAATR